VVLIGVVDLHSSFGKGMPELNIICDAVLQKKELVEQAVFICIQNLGTCEISLFDRE
jgi:hypothetical protein